MRAEDLYRVLQSIDEERVELDLDEDGQLSVTSNNTKAWLAVDGLGETLEDLVDGMGVSTLKSKNWQALPDDFIPALELCAFAASNKAENMAYHALYFDGRDVWATDDYRISNYRFSKDIEFELDGVLLPLGAIKELCKHTPRHLQTTSAWVHFKDGDGLLFSVRIVQTDFKDCSEFIKVKGDPVTLPNSLADALAAVLVFSPGDDVTSQEAEIEFVDKVLVCSTQNDRGRIERRVKLDKTADTKILEGLPKMIINPTFFAEVMLRTTTLTIEKGRALFSTKKFKHVMNLTMLPD